MGTALAFGRFGFASDAGWLYQAGIPTVCYGPGDPMIAHKENESIAVEKVHKYAEILTSFIDRWSGP